MRPRSFLFLSLALLTLPTNAQTYIIHTNLLDVNAQRTLPDYTIVFRNDTIEQTGPSDRIRVPPGARVIDGTGRWVMPGLVDAHVHFFQTGGLYTRPDAIDLRKYYPYENEIEWYKQNMDDQLRRYLSCGITTVIDDGATLGLLKQRDSFSTKNYAPRILMAGPLISTAYSPKPFDVLSDPDQPFYTVNTPEEAVKMTKKQYDHRPDFIKIWYIILDPNTTAGAEKNLPLVKATIEEAHQHGYKVAVHATQRIAAQLAVEAGADFLVHDIEDEIVDDAFVKLLKDHNVVLCPTLVVVSGYFDTFAQNYLPTPEDIAKGNPVQLGSLQELSYLPDSLPAKRYRMLAKMRAQRNDREDSIRQVNLKKMADGGVLIATGTDAGNIGTLHASSFFKEIRAMQQAGLSNWQVLTASTLNGAKVLGKENEFGSVRKGSVADLLLLRADPVADLGSLGKIDMIIHRGTVFHPDSLIDETPLNIVQRQVNAYNAHDLESFLSFYSDTAVIYNFPDKPMAKGIEQIRKLYTFLSKDTGLHVSITNRTVVNNKVFDHESATMSGRKLGEGEVIYYIDDRKITKVYLIE
ncbi:MAG TPA: amidohydrolase family protein [Puia sp.]|nr:amidohydrolase family protein [Puia sp.]